MIKVIPNEKRHHANHDWLDTHWHFSFSDYFDPDNVQWSVLRVFNDDIVAPDSGFPFHPHQNMEIVTLVVDGELTHRDSLGHEGKIGPGDVQVMSAGSGIIHSEFNASQTKPVHLYQLWLLPRLQGRKPRWDQKSFDPFATPGTLVPVVSGGGVPGTLTIDQDAVIYLGELTAGQTVTHALKPGRKGYLFVVSGSLDLNGKRLNAGDQGRIENEQSLQLTARETARLVILDLP
jgi:redox-sensitive bicupin YhaK (pirin superfamily)